MPRVIRMHEATRLTPPGRVTYEIVSAATANASITLRRVAIPPAGSASARRGQHRHADFVECIHVLSGRGITSSGSDDTEVGPGDTILIAPGEFHATRNIGDEPLVLLCFFPVGDIRPGTEEPAVPSDAASRS